MSLSDALKEKQLDVRLRDKLISEEKLAKDEVAKYLGELGDETSNLTYTDQEEENSAGEQGSSEEESTSFTQQ